MTSSQATYSPLATSMEDGQQSSAQINSQQQSIPIFTPGPGYYYVPGGAQIVPPSSVPLMSSGADGNIPPIPAGSPLPGMSHIPYGTWRPIVADTRLLAMHPYHPYYYYEDWYCHIVICFTLFLTLTFFIIVLVYDLAYDDDDTRRRLLDVTLGQK